MNLLSPIYFTEYKEYLAFDLASALEEIDNIELTPRSFTFYTSVAVISSSKIEGEAMEIDSYVKHKMQEIEYLSDLVEKPNDLYRAYMFASEHSLTFANFKHSHVLLSEHLLPKNQRGAYRKNEMLVMEHKTGRIQYEAAPFSIVEQEIDKLWADIEELKNSHLSVEEVFYYASFIHIAFVNIHPFNDGNGRAGRLLEKWFLAEQLGEKGWYIKSEKYYYHHINEYYQNLNRLGMFYAQLDYSKANSFLQMLPNAIHYEL